MAKASAVSSAWPVMQRAEPGILGTTWLLTKVTRARLDSTFKWVDVLGVSLLAGIGFTVSLLVAELSFGNGSLHDDHAKVGILAASVLAALLAAAVLRTRNRQYRQAQEAERIDSDRDGIPDVARSGFRRRLCLAVVRTGRAQRS